MISGPSGTGKGAICAGLLEYVNVAVSISMTTRAPRENEVNGKSYYFINREKFEEGIEKGGFFEYAEIYGEYYGTPKKPVLEQLKKGVDVILEIDVKGAMQVREQAPDAVLIFVMPPSPEELRRRIEGRGTETPERIARRLERADSEIAQVGKYNYCVVNGKLSKAVKDIRMIMRSEWHFSADFEEARYFMPSVTRAIHRAGALRVAGDWEKIIERYNAGKLK